MATFWYPMHRLPIILTSSAFLIAGLLAFAAGWKRDEPATPASIAPAPDQPPGRLAQQVDRLAQRLDEEIERRVALEEQLAVLLAASAETPGVEPADPQAGSPGTARAASRRRAFGPALGFDPEPMLGAGFARRDVETYATLLDEVELRRLELRDRAVREGWLHTPRFASENQELSDEQLAARDIYGEEFADWALFASGQTNRLRVGEVISGSAAANAGLEPGDVLERYAHTRIQAFEDLRALTSAGSAGESTPIEVTRDGTLVTLTIPRGPLGVRIVPVRQEPSLPR